MEFWDAITEGDVDQVRSLIDEGEDIERPLSCGEKPLYLSILFGALPVMDLLLASGADPNDQAEPPKRTPPILGFASAGEHDHDATRAGLRRLIAAGADPSAEDERGETLLMKIADAKGAEFLIPVLAEYGVDINGMSPGGWTALGVAAYRNNQLAASALIAAGADVNIADRDDWTPLHLAARYNAAECAKLLVEAGAKAVADTEGKTPLDVAQSEFQRKGLSTSVWWIVHSGLGARRPDRQGTGMDLPHLCADQQGA